MYSNRYVGQYLSFLDISQVKCIEMFSFLSPMPSFQEHLFQNFSLRFERLLMNILYFVDIESIIGTGKRYCLLMLVCFWSCCWLIFKIFIQRQRVEPKQMNGH